MQAVQLYKQSRPSASTRLRAESVKSAPKGTVITIANLPQQGKADTNLVLVEFSDYECPFCARHATGVAAQLDKEFVGTGKMRHVFANNPLPMHHNAKLLATAAICAGEQGKYWQMHDVLFASKPQTKEDIVELAGKLPTNIELLQNCLNNNTEAAKRIEAESEQAKRLGLQGTPGFALGHSDAAGQVHVEKLIMGAIPFEVFKKAINESLPKSSRS